MSASEPQDVVTNSAAAEKSTASTSAPYPYEWEFSESATKRFLAFIGLRNWRDVTIAAASVALTLVVTLAVQIGIGVFDKPTDTSISDQVNYGDVDPDLFEPSLKVPAAPVTVYVGSETYKTLPADVKNNPFCRSVTNTSPCDFEQHVFIFEKLLNKQQLSALYRVMDVFPEDNDWSFVEVTNWQHVNALPGGVSADYYLSNGSLKRAEIYVK